MDAQITTLQWIPTAEKHSQCVTQITFRSIATNWLDDDENKIKIIN